MAKTKLQPKCGQLVHQLVSRAEQQLREAFPLLKQQGKLTSFETRDVLGKRVQWNECMGAYCITLRFNEHGDLLYNEGNECWFTIDCCDRIADLAKAADYLLNVAHGKA